jgi:hypothetical protein
VIERVWDPRLKPASMTRARFVPNGTVRANDMRHRLP